MFNALHDSTKRDDQVVMIPRNHDLHFLWDGVFAELQSIIAPVRTEFVERVSE